MFNFGIVEVSLSSRDWIIQLSDGATVCVITLASFRLRFRLHTAWLVGREGKVKLEERKRLWKVEGYVPESLSLSRTASTREKRESEVGEMEEKVLLVEMASWGNTKRTRPNSHREITMEGKDWDEDVWEDDDDFDDDFDDGDIDDEEEDDDDYWDEFEDR